MFNPYYSLAQNFSFISPTIYKSRLYKNLIQLTRDNVFERNVEPELLWLKEFLPQKAVFLDIGAGIGNYVYYLDYILFPENIYAFEPNKKLYKKLKKLFPKINFEPLALSDKTETSTLSFPIIDTEELFEKATLKEIAPENEAIKIYTQKVQSMRLDDWINSKEISRLDFIKILMIKIEQEFHQENIWEVISKIVKFGYTAHYLHREKFGLEPLTPEILTQQNTIFAKNDSRYIKNIIFIKN